MNAYERLRHVYEQLGFLKAAAHEYAPGCAPVGS
jgi:hypothetical protein